MREAWRAGLIRCAIPIACLQPRLLCRAGSRRLRVVAAEMLRRYPKETISAFLMREPWTDPVYRAGIARSRECGSRASLSDE